MSYYHDDITMLRAKFNQSSTQDRGRPPTRRLFLGDEGVPEAGTRGFRYLMLAHRSGVESGIAQLGREIACDIGQPEGLVVVIEIIGALRLLPPRLAPEQQVDVLVDRKPPRREQPKRPGGDPPALRIADSVKQILADDQQVGKASRRGRMGQ